MSQLLEKNICQGFPISFRFLNSPFLTRKCSARASSSSSSCLRWRSLVRFSMGRIERDMLRTLVTARAMHQFRSPPAARRFFIPSTSISSSSHPFLCSFPSTHKIIPPSRLVGPLPGRDRGPLEAQARRRRRDRGPLAAQALRRKGRRRRRRQFSSLLQAI